MPSKTTKVTKSTPPPSKTAVQGQSLSLNYIPTSIAKRTRTQLADPAGQGPNEPMNKVAHAKSKVNRLKFTFWKLYSFFWLLQEKEVDTEIVKEADISWKERCKILLEILNRSKDSVEIRKPVSILDVPDYLEFVDHPMDLQTVWQQMQDGHYATPKDFAKDVRLIFQNAKNYYKKKESRIFGMTFRLSLLFEDFIRHILFCYKHRKTSAQSKLSKTDGRI